MTIGRDIQTFVIETYELSVFDCVTEELGDGVTVCKGFLFRSLGKGKVEKTVVRTKEAQRGTKKKRMKMMERNEKKHLPLL
jgi:hypothetical protein